MAGINCIDIGNTRYKIGRFNHQGEIDLLKTGASTDYNKLITDLNSLGNEKLIGSDVKGIEKAVFSGFDITWIHHNWKFPFQVNYLTPETLGMDRLLNLTGAYYLLKKTPLMVVSLGTCITIDMLNEKNQFTGGNISPGMKMRYKSVHEHTGKLPLLDFELSEEVFGSNTDQAIHAGVQQGIIHEVNAYLNLACQVNKNVEIIITGGDADYFVNRFKRKIFAEPNLTLFGLYSLALKNGIKNNE
jgi:type III pantothenate kinase